MELKVISFNIRCCDDPDGYSIEERAPRLNQIVASYDADLIGFQEYRPQWEPYITSFYEKEYEIFNKYRSAEDYESSPILWKKDKFELLKTGYFWLSDTPEVESKGWDELCNCSGRCVNTILKHKESGKVFTFLNTHFGFGDKGQIASVELIKKYIENISDNPTFIVGDFNMKPTDAAYPVMTKYFTDVNAVTAKDWQTTYHGYNPEGKTEHIDYCFVDGKVKPVDLKVIYETVDGKYPSDHFGLFIKLDI